MTINPNDAVIVCARNEDDVSHLEARNAYTLLPLMCTFTCTEHANTHGLLTLTGLYT